MSGIVQMTTLGRNGRFGNQLFQYALLRTYAEHVGATLETPPWVGQRLFGLWNPPISRSLPLVDEPAVSTDPGNWYPNMDLKGWFQKPGYLKLISRSAVRQWFTFRPEWRKRFPKRLPHYTACHMRQGDFPTDPGRYCLISRESYWKAVAKSAFAEWPVVWVEEDKAKPEPSLPADLQFLPDFLTLCDADILFRSNSTFAWWAGELGDHLDVYSPAVGQLHGPNDVEFVEGNAEQHAPFEGYGPLQFGKP